ncbi:Whirly domain-containing protein [Cephalotus follicularis]|uniref:Whirly domain-containing protein n=1 Tax=Cephalotus follicularis TaxID=3775 RepID=A0A1Q3BW47_CEPFO|nr:Whirly domain-containing protein [Cephalotus follicularis]
MMKLSRSLLSRNLSYEKRLFGEAGDVRDALCLHVFAFQSGISTATRDFSLNVASKGNSAARVYAPYTVYKGKAALSVAPILPSFTKLDSGTFRVERQGVMLLTIWPSIGERKYDWERRQRFALSATEVGSLISMGPTTSSEFFHDPSMLSSNAGQVRKSLKIKAFSDGTGYFISLGVANNILKSNEQFVVPITTAEFTVMKTACSFVLPHLMGWDRVTNQSEPVDIVGKLSKENSQLLDSEWDK